VCVCVCVCVCNLLAHPIYLCLAMIVYIVHESGASIGRRFFFIRVLLCFGIVVMFYIIKLGFTMDFMFEL